MRKTARVVDHVLDASAVLAYTNREPGWEAVESIDDPLISAVNFAEVISKMTERGYSVRRAVDAARVLKLRVVDFDETQAIEAARLRPLTIKFGLSLGDRACLALASLRGLPAMTSERKWVEAAPHVKVVAIR